jgi:hypothetical protein|tara:strand:- start:36 stop:236 length:201 start_codon:yes stop_codon:yes gene_type:complete
MITIIDGWFLDVLLVVGYVSLLATMVMLIKVIQALNQKISKLESDLDWWRQEALNRMNFSKKVLRR